MNYNDKMKTDLVNRLEELRTSAAEVFNQLEHVNHTQFDDYVLYQEQELNPTQKLIMMDIHRAKDNVVTTPEAYHRLNMTKAQYGNHMRDLIDECYVVRLSRSKYAMTNIY